ncbi:hypothetical protein FJU30_20970 [Affinibrenneria salicis]|uniref:Uncharacterized protein n=1 Tax=Affinibrenneria salicis TaxID=2590031 RepID=A0A5J5FT22_9GAMM|nr:hypothetical protein [Affinibrenneria salicis]KAA8996680.1 hypothetical protein FJU30_20970 [Affinibrenneria salicis]
MQSAAWPLCQRAVFFNYYLAISELTFQICIRIHPAAYPNLLINNVFPFPVSGMDAIMALLVMDGKSLFTHPCPNAQNYAIYVIAQEIPPEFGV